MVVSASQATERNQNRLPFDLIGFRKGGPTLRTTPIKIYWKHETKNNAVFSEFSMLLFSRSTRGG